MSMMGMLDFGDDDLTLPRVMGTSYAIDLERYQALGGDLKDGLFNVQLGRRPGTLKAGEEAELFERIGEMGGSIHYAANAVVQHYIRNNRLTWSWLFRRSFAAGQESRDPLLRGMSFMPRPKMSARQSLADQLIRAILFVPFLAGAVKESLS
jgi:hypothetical protein